MVASGDESVKVSQLSRLKTWLENKMSSTSISGNAATATKLATARTLSTALGTSGSVSFDGSSNVNVPVTGTLSVAHGGTGGANADAARANLGFSMVKRLRSNASGTTGSVVVSALSTYDVALVEIILTSGGRAIVPCVIGNDNPYGFNAMIEGSTSYLVIGNVTVTTSTSSVSATGISFPISGYVIGTGVNQVVKIGNVYGIKL